MTTRRALALVALLAVGLAGCPKPPPVVPPLPKTSTGEEPAKPGPPPLERPGDPPKNAEHPPPG